MSTAIQIAIENYKKDGVSFTDWFMDNYELLLEEEKGNMVRMLRWVLKNYYSSQDIEGSFCWENPIGELFDSIDLINEYYKQNFNNDSNNFSSN